MTRLPHASPEELNLDPRRLESAFDRLEEWTSGPRPAIPGGAILVGRGGKTLPPRFFGRQTQAPSGPPIRQDAVFLMASLTKPIVYMGALMLVERGLLNLSDPVTRYIPEFAAHHKDPTLVVHLFTHTSGLPDMLENDRELRASHAPLSRFIEGAIRDTVPLFPPGTDFSYQSMGTLVVAEIIQRITGQSIHEYLQRQIFQPLGLESTRLGSQGLDEARIVEVQTPDWHGPDFGWNSPYWRRLGAPWGTLFSTPEEFAVLCQLMLQGGAVGRVRLLSPGTVQQMTTSRLDDQADLPERVRRGSPWGLGWKINVPGSPGALCDLLGRQVFGHTGSTGNLVWLDPASGAFCILFTTAERARAPWRLVHLSNAVAAAVW
jgi:CubicO group peptidase (beta-lactamase class C family)